MDFAVTLDNGHFMPTELMVLYMFTRKQNSATEDIVEGTIRVADYFPENNTFRYAYRSVSIAPSGAQLFQRFEVATVTGIALDFRAWLTNYPLAQPPHVIISCNQANALDWPDEGLSLALTRIGGAIMQVSLSGCLA